MGKHLQENNVKTLNGQSLVGAGDIVVEGLTGGTLTLQPNNEFETVLYTGNGSTQTVNLSNINNGVDFVWIKDRTAAQNHRMFNSLSGVTKYLSSSNTNTEAADANSLTGVTNSSFTLGSSVSWNGSGDNYVAWVASLPNENTNNTDGTITSHTKSNSFMSAVSYTGIKANATIGHGLGKAPELIIVKNRDIVSNWAVYNKTIDATDVLFLSLPNAKADAIEYWNDTEPTDSVFSLGTNSYVNGSGEKVIAYAFASVEGKCKVGSYTGTGASGNFVETGFEPQFVMCKRTDTTGEWKIFDNTRGGDKALWANLSDAEGTQAENDFNATGFTLNNTGTGTYGANVSGGAYIFLAIAKDTLQGDNNLVINALNISNCPTYADDTSADTGGLVTGDVYKTATGELRIKLQ